MRKNTLRVGAVSYLNTRPLVYGLQSGKFGSAATDFELCFDLPSRLADRLAGGELDVALIPSIEFASDPGYRIVSDACIGCRGPVWSVKLYFRVPPSQVRTLALDEGSRTSAVLAQILLAERFGVRPELTRLPIGASADTSNSDAVLLIGDRAIHPPQASGGGDFVESWDLGDQWCRWSERPFVFAMWVARSGVELGNLEAQLAESRDTGLAHLEEIAHHEAAHVRLSPKDCLGYLRDNLYFYLGRPQREGLGLYFERAAAWGLISADAVQRLKTADHDCKTTG